MGSAPQLGGRTGVAFSYPPLLLFLKVSAVLLLLLSAVLLEGTRRCLLQENCGLLSGLGWAGLLLLLLVGG